MDSTATRQLLGLGEDNENTGRLNRRGTIRDLWAGQKNPSPATSLPSIRFRCCWSTGRRGHAYGVFYGQCSRTPFRSGEVRFRRGPLRQPRRRDRPLCHRWTRGSPRLSSAIPVHRASLVAAAVGLGLLAKQNARFATGRKFDETYQQLTPNTVFPST